MMFDDHCKGIKHSFKPKNNNLIISPLEILGAPVCIF